MEQSKRIYRKEKALTVLFAGSVIVSSYFCAGELLKIPSGADGFTVERYLLFGVLAFFAVFGLFSLGLTLFTPKSVRFWFLIADKRVIRRSTFGLLLVFLFLLLMPATRFGNVTAYYERLYPLVLQFFLTLLSFTLCFYSPAYLTHLRKIAPDKKSQAIFGIFTLIAVIIIFILEWSGWGKIPEKQFWNKPGVPLLSLQLATSILFTLFLLYFAKRINRLNHFIQKDWLIFLLIWGVAALLWCNAPTKAHFFAPGPYPPNFESYPYSDAVAYNLMAQQGYDGLLFRYGITLYKPVVTFIQFLCMVLSGNHFNVAIIIQCAFFAILPAIVYLCVKELSSFTSGILAALFVIAQEWNALITFEVMTIHSKLLMSEFLLQLLIACIGLCLVRWIKRKSLIYAALSGVFLSLALYTRYNTAAFLPLILLLALICLRKNLRFALLSITITGLAFCISISPWVYRGFQSTGKILPELFGSYQTVILDQRLNDVLKHDAEPIATQTIITPIKAKESAQFDAPETPIFASYSAYTQKISIHPYIDRILNHSTHNLIGSFLILPLQAVFDTLQHVFNNPLSVWQDTWNYRFTVLQSVFIALNTLIILCGMSAVWIRYGTSALILPALWVGYAVSLAVASTSGDRYLVPMNWAILSLYAIGLGSILNWLCRIKIISAQEESARINRTVLMKSALVILAGFMFYLSFYIVERRMPNRIRTAETSSVINEASQAFADQDIDWKTVSAQINTGEMLLLQGRAVYPRFYYFLTGEKGSDAAFYPKDFSRIIFNLIAEKNTHFITLPVEFIPEQFEHDSAVAVFACVGESYELNALAALGNTKNGEAFAYLRSPLTEFSCPVRNPICPSVDHCY